MQTLPLSKSSTQWEVCGRRETCISQRATQTEQTCKQSHLLQPKDRGGFTIVATKHQAIAPLTLFKGNINPPFNNFKQYLHTITVQRTVLIQHMKMNHTSHRQPGDSDRQINNDFVSNETTINIKLVCSWTPLCAESNYQFPLTCPLSYIAQPPPVNMVLPESSSDDINMMGVVFQ